MTKQQKVLVYGGSFAPPTLAHEAIIAACLKLLQFDEVWVLPSGDRIDKIVALSEKDRLQMLEIMKTERFANDPRFKITNFELSLPRPTQTSRSVQALADAYPNTDFWFAFGRDSYMAMPSWPDGRKLQENLKMVVLCTGPGAALQADNVMMIELSDAYANVSSTAVREALRTNQSLQGLVSEPIASFLIRRDAAASGKAAP